MSFIIFMLKLKYYSSIKKNKDGGNIDFKF